jgi:hypothetical protein
MAKERTAEQKRRAAASQRLYCERHPERARESIQRWKKANPEKRREARRANNKRHPERKVRYQRRRQLRNASKSRKFMSAIVAAIPANLPLSVRTEILASVSFEVAEGKLLLRDIPTSVKASIRTYYATYENRRFNSLDAEIAGTNGLRRIDLLTEDDLWKG